MIFNSLTFLIFLCIVWGLYYILPARGRIWLLMVASLTFYGFWRVEFLAVLLLSAFTDFLVSIQLSKVRSQLHRRLLVALSLTVNLGLLAYFKYLYFIVENLNVLGDALGLSGRLELWDIILPLGISFYTFQTISYTIDVYRGHTEPVPDFVVYTTYVTFFPQLIAGPVLRASEVIGQLQAMPTPKVEDIIEGLRRITLGLFLKVGLADNIAPLVDDGFMVPMDSLGALDVWTLTFLFGFQIYFDFSAYSSIAIGCARLLGIQFPENFNFPYFATGARDFWKRWHISLSSWIRDYLYLPLTGAKVTNDGSRGGLGVTELKRDRALILTWLIMGLWHGASWTFVLWGAFHALWVLSERWLQAPRIEIPEIASFGIRMAGDLARGHGGLDPFSS